MSKGNRIVPIRFTPDLLQQIEKALASRNMTCRDAPDTLSEWIRDACSDRLDHIAAAARQRQRKKAATAKRRAEKIDRGRLAV